MKRLVFIHGRSQQDKDAVVLKREWIAAWQAGLDKSGLAIPLPEDRIRFAYYGDTLRDMCEGKSADDAAKVIVRGANDNTEANTHLANLLDSYIAALQITDDEIEAELQVLDPSPVKERGPQNWAWVQAVIRTIDNHVPGAGVLIALVTNDVHQYLGNNTINRTVMGGVTQAFDRNDDHVVVSHSLGTIVAYTLMQRFSAQAGWRVPLLVTLGSPLGIKSIRKRLVPLKHPACVGEWFNALDRNDVVALYPLDAGHFNVTPPILNKTDVDNHTSNQHGIGGYLDDEDVARRIHAALA
jgi:hypothetical protein